MTDTADTATAHPGAPAGRRRSRPLAGDPTLVARALVGDGVAVEELYRRHADAAWRVAQAVTRNPEDAADAVSEAFCKVLAAIREGRYRADAPFRPYLLASVRNAAIDTLRRGSRSTPVPDDFPFETHGPRPDDTEQQVIDLTDTRFAAEAFRELPERWRTVLWLTAVEGMPPRRAAEVLGLSANSTSQLAVRARAGLRERFVQAHARRLEEDSPCRWTTERLGAYVTGGLAARDVAKVDQHLAGCGECRRRRAELDDVGGSLRRLLIPVPVGLAGTVTAAWTASVGAASGAAGVAGGLLERITGGARSLERAAASAAAATLGLGLAVATSMGGAPAATPFVPASPPPAEAPASSPSPPPPAGAPPAEPTGAPPAEPTGAPIPQPPAVAAPRTPVPLPGTAAGDGRDEPAPAPEPTPTTTAEPPADDPTLPDPGGPTDDAGAPEPDLQAAVGGRWGDQTASVGVGVGPDSRTGVQLGPLTVGDPPPARSDDGLEADVGGTMLPTDPDPVGLP